jgi:hypothetical protein
MANNFNYQYSNYLLMKGFVMKNVAKYFFTLQGTLLD